MSKRLRKLNLCWAVLHKLQRNWKKYLGLFWWDLGYLEYWISGYILSIYGADHYFFGSWGMKIFPRQTIFFCTVVSKTFFSGVIFLQTIFFLPAKNLVGLFFCFCKQIFPSYGLQRTNLFNMNRWTQTLSNMFFLFSNITFRQLSKYIYLREQILSTSPEPLLLPNL